MDVGLDDMDERQPLLSKNHIREDAVDVLAGDTVEASSGVVDNVYHNAENLEFNPVLTLKERLCFFALGMGPVLAWNCVFVSENYFKETLGHQVLSRLGMCQNVSCLIVMAVLLFMRKQFTTFAAPVTGCFFFMSITCILVLASVILDNGIPDYGLYLLIIGNGLATGIAQTRLGVLAGLYGKTGQCGALLFAGNSLGAVLPPVLQTSWTVSQNLSPKSEESHVQNLQAAQVVFGVGLFGTLCSVAAMIKLSQTDNFVVLTSPAQNHTVNDLDETSDENNDIARERRSLNVVKWTELAIVVARGVMSYMLSISPYVPSLVPKSQGAPTFWDTQLAAILIGCGEVGDLIGRLIANSRHFAMVSLAGLLVFTAVPLGFIPFTIVYIEHPFNLENNWLILWIYTLMAGTHGYLVVSLSSKAQSVCEFISFADPGGACPVVAHLSWVATQVGLVAGVALSFIPVSEPE